MMEENRIEQYIQLKKHIGNEDYEKINELEKLCINKDKVNLKLELNYRLSIRKESSNPLKAINEFLYYAGDNLIGYLGVSSFQGNEAEINGMVHPDWRRKGIFTRLYELAKDECKRRGFKKILLLCDGKSQSGKSFIESKAASYSFSEYKMKLEESNRDTENRNIELRKAKNYDGVEIGRLNSIFFGDPDIQIEYPEEEEKNNQITYMIDLEEKSIGKIRVETQDNLAYIYGFGIVPEYRGRGYGREALAAALQIINDNNAKHVYLDVEAKNSKALNLYKSCGFVEEATMNYYEVI